MTIYTYPDATATIDGTALELADGDLTLDSSRYPYAESTVTVPMVSEALLEKLTTGQRVTVRAGDGSTAITADLSITSREVSHDRKELRIRVASDEVLLDAWAPIAHDSTPRTHEANLRDLVNYVLNRAIPGATLQPGTANADLTAHWDARNLAFDAGTAAIPGGGGYIAGNVDVEFSDYSWSISGDGDSFVLHKPKQADSFLAMGQVSSYLLAHAIGRPHVLSASANPKVALGGTEMAGRARRLVVIHKRPSDPYYTVEASNPAVATVGTVTRLIMEVNLPEGTNACEVRAYHGHTTGEIRYDGFRLTERGPGTVAEDATFFDGDTPDTPSYRYDWEGAQDNSISTRTATPARLPILFTWRAGQSAWNFLEPLTASAGLRLFCDERRRWYLVHPTEYRVPGRYSARVDNTVTATDLMDVDDEETGYTGVVVYYEWEDAQGVTRTAMDTAGTAGKVKVLKFETASSPGVAAAHLKKIGGQIRQQHVTTATDYTVRPGQEIQIDLPGTSPQIGTITRAQYQLTTGLMSLASGGLRETPDGAIDLLAPTIDHLTGTINNLT